MKRKEINIEISHDKVGTPDRASLRKSIINKLKSKDDNVYIIRLQTDTGTNRSLCYTEIYDDAGYAKKVVPKYIVERNFPSKKEEKKPEKESKVKEEKPKKEEKEAGAKEKTEEAPKAEEVKPSEEVKPKEEEKPKEVKTEAPDKSSIKEKSKKNEK